MSPDLQPHGGADRSPGREPGRGSKERKKPQLFRSPVFQTAPPNTLNFNGAHRKRKTLVAPEINISLDQSEGSLLSDDFLDTPDDLDINVDDIETPDETDSLEFLGNGNELEWEGEAQGCSPRAELGQGLQPRAHGTAPGGSLLRCDPTPVFLEDLRVCPGGVAFP